MTRHELIEQIKGKRSFLCVGLDTDPKKIPAHLGSGPDAMLAFNKVIVDHTKEFAVAYKPNTAFYEAHGPDGWRVLQETIAYIPDECLTIADAKRGDIGNTAEQYANAFFYGLGADAITLSPYMGKDSIAPFVTEEGKWAIMLGVTSNTGASDLQFMGTDRGGRLFEQVVSKGTQWGGAHRLMFVVGATRPEIMEEVRAMAPDHFFLVPGVGAQGGSLDAVMKAGLNKDIGLIVNSSRGIIYAGGGSDFGEKAAEKAQEIRSQMETALIAAGIL